MISRMLSHTRRTESEWCRVRVVRAFAAFSSLAALLLTGPGAFAAQERMPLDGLGASSCDWNGCTVANLDEDPDGPGADWATATDNTTSHAGHFTFATPTQPLSSGAGLQEFRASVRQDAACGGNQPSARIELWENGALVRAGTAVGVTAPNSCTQGTDCQVVSFTWDATEVTSAADVEVQVFGVNSGGKPSSRCAVDLGAVEWNAEVGAVGPTLPTLSSPTSPFATIDTGNAILGATIDTNGGGTITAYGTVWDTSPAPTVNAATAGTDNPAMPHTYAHSRAIAQTPGTLIYFRGYATNGTGTGYSPDGSFYLEPNQASGVTFSNVTSSGMRISWSPPGTGAGSGSIVVVKQGTAVDSDPVDGVTHAASASFGSGDQLGTGNYVVFRAAGTQVDVLGLSPSTTYHVAVYQYAGTTVGSINYQQDTPATASQATTAPAAVPTLSSPTATAIDTGNATLGATIDSGAGITSYGTTWGTSPAPTGNPQAAGGAVTPPQTYSHSRSITQTPGTLIYFRGYAINGDGTGYSPDGSFYLEPNQASGVTFSNITGSGMRISWSPPGTGAGSGSIVVVKQGTAVDSNPVDGVAHAANATFGSGAQLGTGNYVVFRAAGTQVDVNGLSPSTTYHVAVYQYAGTTAPSINYQQDTPATGNQATSAAGPTPTLSSPTVSGIGSTSATLGATIDSGSGITAYGTVWGTSPAPTGNALAAGGAVSPPHTFSHARTGLPASTRIYYRGYATNGAGTGYSPDDSFYTDPGSQVARINFMSTTETELIVSWTRGNGDGAIVLISESYAVDADPADETEYTANPAFGSGEQIGTGNYVIYVGTGTQVTVTGIQPDIPYYIAAYMYAGSGTGPGGINYLQASPARGSSGHNGSHGINCVNCHFGTGALHGSFAVPRDLDQEAVCLSCHNDTGVASAKKDVGLHTGTKYNANVDCGSCHEVHNNFDFSTTDTHSGGVTAPNVEWLRSNTTKYVSGALEPALFQANTGFFAWDDANAPWNGVCQTCHQNTDFHRNDSSLGAGSHAHNSAADCRTCHSHADGFRGSGGDCTGCHNTQREISANPGNYRRQITETTPGAGNGEFSTGFTSHHVNDGTGAQIVTKWDCVVCHAEGDATTGDTDAAYHMKDGVQLKDTDTGSAYSDWSGLTAPERSGFCLSCHDADGATIITGRTDPDPDATTDPLNPFNDGVTNAHEPDGFASMCPDLRTVCSRDRDCDVMGGGVCSPLTAPHPRGRCSVTNVIACGTAYECPSGETCEFPQVVDVFSQFDTANASHHAVRGQAYASAAPFGSNLDNAIQGARTDLAWNSVLDCEDCHYGTATNMLQGHGTANARYMLRDKTGADTFITPSGTGNLNVNCFRCHIPSGDPSTYPGTESAYDDHTQGSHIDDTLNLFGISCLNCHAGAEFGGIHGMDGPVTDDDSSTSFNPNVFTWGSGLDYISNWGSGPGQGVSCSARQDPTLLNDCTQHGSQSYTRTPARTYRAP